MFAAAKDAWMRRLEPESAAPGPGNARSVAAPKTAIQGFFRELDTLRACFGGAEPGQQRWAMGDDRIHRGFPVPGEPLRIMSGNPAPRLVVPLAMWHGKENAATLRVSARRSGFTCTCAGTRSLVGGLNGVVA
mgnify:CR=1 FL=1